MPPVPGVVRVALLGKRPVGLLDLIIAGIIIHLVQQTRPAQAPEGQREAGVSLHAAEKPRGLAWLLLYTALQLGSEAYTL